MGSLCARVFSEHMRAFKEITALLTVVIILVELLWDRKYEESGAKTAPLQLALPFQTIETR